jgi:transposase InsO family protein
MQVSLKKVGFDQPTRVHEHWHTDISYLNIKGTFVYLIYVIDGYFRSILSWYDRIKMESIDIQIVLWRACDKYLTPSDPNNPRLITANGSQFFTKRI